MQYMTVGYVNKSISNEEFDIKRNMQPMSYTWLIFHMNKNRIKCKICNK